MRYHIIGNERQVRALAVIGLKGDIVSNQAEALIALESILKDSTVGTVLISESYYSLPEIKELIHSHEKRGTLPVILCLNDQGSSPEASQP